MRRAGNNETVAGRAASREQPPTEECTVRPKDEQPPTERCEEAQWKDEHEEEQQLEVQR